MQERAKTWEMRANDKTHQAEGGETQAPETDRQEGRKTTI